MKETTKGNYRTRGFEITKKINSEGSGLSPKKNSPRSSVIIGNDLRVKESKK